MVLRGLIAVGFARIFCPPTDTKELLEELATIFCSSTGTKEIQEELAQLQVLKGDCHILLSRDIEELLQGMAIVLRTLILGSILSMSDRT